jgi:hypothetical protein
MKYLYLLYADESKMPAADSPQMQQQEAAFGKYYEELSGRGMFKAGDPVQPSKTATTVRVRNGSTKTASGPATSGTEQIIGFYVVEAKKPGRGDRLCGQGAVGRRRLDRSPANHRELETKGRSPAGSFPIAPVL